MSFKQKVLDRWAKKFPYLLVVISGFTGLVYQVTWQKYLTFHLGSHAFATTSILAMFFLSLSLGYFFIGNRSHRWMKNQLLLYGLIEGLIGVYCLISPEIFHYLQNNFPSHFENRGVEMAMGLLFTAIFIGPPTFLMGGTIPVLTQALVAVFEESHHIHARIYGLNTFGAFAGTLLAGFIFTDLWGLPLTLIYTSFFNLFIAAVTYIYFKWRPHHFAGLTPQIEKTKNSAVKSDWQIRAVMYAISFLSGFYVFSLESIVIRMAGISIGATTYAFAMIVAAFILAIALGGYWVSWAKRSLGLKSFYFVQMALVVTSILLYLSVPYWPEFFAWIAHLIYASISSFWIYWAVITFITIVMLLIPVGLMGMNLPLLFHFLKARDSALSSTVGRVYAVNSIGSALGAVVGGYLLFYFWDGPTLFKFDILLMALSLIMIGVLVFKKTNARNKAFGAAVILIVVVLFLPQWPSRNFIPGLYGGNLNRTIPFRDQIENIRLKNPLVVSKYDPDALVGVTGKAEQKVLYVNGNSNTGPSDTSVRALNALIPLALVPQPEQAFIIGLGSGLSTALLAQEASIKKLDVAEIAKGVIDVQSEFKYENQKLFDHKSKINLIHADAYRVLRANNQKYSIIICEPAHPWISGVENLYAMEFLEVVRDHLTEDGVFTQWLPLFSAEPKTVMAILRTFKTVFPWVGVWSSADGVMALVGAKREPRVSAQHLDQLSISQKPILDKLRLSHASSILGMQLLTGPGLDRLLEYVQGLHTLEFPMMGKSYYQQRYIGNFVQIRSLLGDHSVKTREHFNADDQFIYERFWGHQVPESFYKDYLKKDRGFSLTSSIEDRLRFQYQVAYPQNKLSQIPSKPFKAMKYMVSATPSKKDLSKTTYTDQEISDLFDTFKLLYAAQLPVKWIAVAHLLPEKCLTGVCSRVKSNVIRGFGGEKDLEQAFASKKDKKLTDFIDQLYSRLLRIKLDQS